MDEEPGHIKCNLFYLDVCTSPVENGLQGQAEQALLSCWLLYPKMSQHRKQLQSQIRRKSEGQSGQKFRFS